VFDGTVLVYLDNIREVPVPPVSIDEQSCFVREVERKLSLRDKAEESFSQK
jgi:hypothetical protein